MQEVSGSIPLRSTNLIAPDRGRFFFEMLDHFKAAHQLELDRRDKLLGILSLPVGFLTVAFGALTFLAVRCPIQDAWAAYGMLLGTLVSSVLFAYATFATWRTYHGFLGYEYGYPPDAEDQLKYFKKCLKLYEKYPNKAELAEKALHEELIPIYAKASDRNREINNERYGLLHRANLAIFVLFLLLAASFGCHGYLRWCDALDGLDAVSVPRAAAPNRPLKSAGTGAKIKKRS